VHDESGAVIPGAQVTLHRQGNAAVPSVNTDAEGNFHLPINSDGPYRIEVRATGFKFYSQLLELGPDAPGTNVSITLAVEGSTQTVEVTADALAAETTSTHLGESLDAKKIESVPLNGRFFTDLMAV